MSTYNGEEFIREQLDSVLAQNYPDVDILVRDDGSCDDTYVILKEYEEIHPNIRAYQGKNIGVNKSFFDLLKKSCLTLIKPFQKGESKGLTFTWARVLA